MVLCKNCIHYGICEYSPFSDKDIDCKDFKCKTDYVKIVRCKNCTWYQPYEKPVEDFDGWCSARSCETDDEEFCSYSSNGL